MANAYTSKNILAASPVRSTGENVVTSEADLAHHLGIFTPSELSAQIAQRQADPWLIDGWFREKSLNLLVGDSGLGKTPFSLQMGIAVAAGLNFLGRGARHGRVLHLDGENGSADVSAMLERLARFIGLERPPETLLTWNLNDAMLSPTEALLEKLIEAARPDFLIVDPIYMFFPALEKDASAATAAWQKLRSLQARHGFTTLGIHHRKKQNDEQTPLPLDDCDLGAWFNSARGSNAIVTGTDMRIALDKPCKAKSADLVIRSRRRVDGEQGAIFLKRVYDEDGETALGYELLNGADLVANDAYRAAFDGLPREFSWTEAKTALGKGDQSCKNMLSQFIAAGALQKLAPGKYVKIGDSAASGTVEKQSRWKC